MAYSDYLLLNLGRHCKWCCFKVINALRSWNDDGITFSAARGRSRPKMSYSVNRPLICISGLSELCASDNLAGNSALVKLSGGL